MPKNQSKFFFNRFFALASHGWHGESIVWRQVAAVSALITASPQLDRGCPHASVRPYRPLPNQIVSAIGVTCLTGVN